MATSSRQLFVNIAVEDLERSVAFFERLGFRFDPRFTDETASMMVVGEDAFVMLLTKQRFSDFTSRPTSDATSQTEAILAFSAESREQVDELVDDALAAGATKATEPQDMGFMYMRTFHDLDGHHWEVVWMDPSAIEQMPETAGVQSG